MQHLNTHGPASEIARDGFTNIPSFFSTEEVEKVSHEVHRVLNQELALDKGPAQAAEGLRPYYTTASSNSTGAVGSSFLGKSPILDEFATKLFADLRFIDLCNRLVGGNFRIYTFSMRQLTPQSRALGLHQDNFGSLTISIPLNDIGKGLPTTYFVRGSHRFPINIADIVTPLPIRLFGSLLVPHVCRLGDLGIFLNKTFHGTFRGHSKSTVVLINMVSEGFTYNPWSLPAETSYGMNFREAIGETLFMKLGATTGVVQRGGNSFIDTGSYSDGNENPKLLQMALGGRQMLVLPFAQKSQGEDTCLTWKISRGADYSARSVFLSGYLFCLKVVAYAKHALYKLKRGSKEVTPFV